MARLRCFAGVGFPDVVRGELAALLTRLDPGCPGVKWVDPIGMHLTLKFFGSVDEARLPELTGALKRAAAAAAPFQAQLSGVGAFPDTRKPQILWVGTAQGGPEFVSLARAVEDEAEAIGFEPEPRPFRPHVTLGRAKGDADRCRTGETLETTLFESSSWRVETLRLYQSRPSPAGSFYECLWESPFLP